MEWLCCRPFDESSTQDQRVKALDVWALHTGAVAGGGDDAHAVEAPRFYAVASGNSEGLLTLSLVDTVSRRILEVARFRENRKPVLCLRCVRVPVATRDAPETSQGAVLLVAGATNGCISVWNLNPALRVAQEAAALLRAAGVTGLRDPCAGARASLYGAVEGGGHPDLLSVFQAHAMGVNCLDAKVQPTPESAPAPADATPAVANTASVVVGSGGDGQELVLTRFCVSTTSDSAVAGRVCVSDVSMTMQPAVASAGLRGLHLDADTRVVFLTGTDQRLTVWSYADADASVASGGAAPSSSTGGWAALHWRGSLMAEVAAIAGIDVMRIGYVPATPCCCTFPFVSRSTACTNTSS